MNEEVKETVTTQTSLHNANAPAFTQKATTSQTTEYMVYFLFGLLEALLVFRFFFKVLGASSASGIVQFIYKATNIFVLPFEGIFGRSINNGIANTSVFESATLISIAFYGLLAFGIVRLVIILSGQKQELT